jgi:thioredoxin
MRAVRRSIHVLFAMVALSGPTLSPAADPPRRTSGMPRLVDLGSVHCVPCKVMAPVLDGLRTDYAGRLTVEFIDVWKVKEASKRYRIQGIPTQIFYDAQGREVARHEGFIGRDDILTTFEKAGVKLDRARR